MSTTTRNGSWSEAVFTSPAEPSRTILSSASGPTDSSRASFTRPSPLSSRRTAGTPRPPSDARRSVEHDRLSLEREPRLVKAELRAPLADDQRAQLALDGPCALEKRGQVIGGDIGSAVVHDLERQLTQGALGALDFDRGGTCRGGLSGGHPRQRDAGQHECRQKTHDDETHKKVRPFYQRQGRARNKRPDAPPKGQRVSRILAAAASTALTMPW